MNVEGVLHNRRCEEKKFEICKKLETYLKTGISLDKMVCRKDLQDAIRNYLSIVPPGKKFYHSDIAYVLHKSIEKIQNVSLCRTTAALSALATYAENLYSQPWRKEFLEIRTYSGFYKHKIETSLVGGETVLQLLGYSEPNKNGSMVIYDVINKSVIFYVLLDVFVALVECEIMRTIMENIISLNGGRDYSYLDVLKYREKHIGSADEATTGILNEIRQYYADYHKYYLNQSSANPIPCSYSPAQVHPHQLYRSTAMYTPYIPPPMLGQYQNYPLNSGYMNHCSNYETAARYHDYSVPTGNLIEFDQNSPSNSSAHKRTASDVREPRRRNNEENHYKKFDTYESKLSLCKNSNPVHTAAKLIDSMSINDPEEPSCSKSHTFTSSRKKTKDYYTIDPVGPPSVNKRKFNDHYDSTDIAKYHQTKSFHSQPGKNHRPSTSPVNDENACPKCTLYNDTSAQNCSACHFRLDHFRSYKY